MSAKTVTPASIADLGQGRFAVTGDMSFDTVTALLNEGLKRFEAHKEIVIDMTDVARADSAGLALLLEWLSWARDNERALDYENLPAAILAVAKISDLDGLIDGKAA